MHLRTPSKILTLMLAALLPVFVPAMSSSQQSASPSGPGQASPGQASPGQASPGQASPGQASPGQVSPGQVSLGQVKAGQAKAEVQNTAVVPVPRLEIDSYDWYRRHDEELVVQRKINPEIVLIGDSITHFWSGPPKGNIVNGPKAWDESLGGLRVLNMGFGWDRTQNVLWRLQNGEFEGIHPRVVVLNIGTNNLVATEHAHSNTPEQIVQGILAIHRVVRSRAPKARILVMGIFPRGSLPTDELRAPIAKINGLLAAALAKEPNTEFLEIGKRFLAPDGTIPVTLMSDGTHPTDEGYAIWAKALLDAGIRK